MSELYYGRIGKNKSFGLLSDKRIVVYKKRDSKSRGSKSSFIPVDSLKEAEVLYKNLGDAIFFWDNGDWQEVNFVVQGKTPKIALGFSPG